HPRPGATGRVGEGELIGGRDTADVDTKEAETVPPSPSKSIDQFTVRPVFYQIETFSQKKLFFQSLNNLFLYLTTKVYHQNFN
ncbi:MAG: hypothetical protein KJ874_07305, partial [Acidobacteria bacterium]|nr:hypothetical protein [Acidobacteriota bacterium]